MHVELLRQRGDADAVGAGCSHSVHFLVGQRCSSASPWLCGGLDQRVLGLVSRFGHAARRSIPSGNKPLDPLSPVPAAFHYLHSRYRKTVTR